MTVYLVGAGPGDPGLLTVRGAGLLAHADVVVHDRLVDPSVVRLARPGAEVIDVGKWPGHPAAQDRINALLIERGRAGQLVVRLKGGDPFVFGRGGEEAQALLAAGVPFDVVPGVSAAVAVPAYAGVPVTHRGLSGAVTVVSGYRAGEAEGVDWDALARAGGTVVVLMGAGRRAEIASRLLAGGRDPETPVLAVRWGTQPAQRSVRTTLAELPDVALESPVTMVIGPVAGLDLSWFERRPLFGRTVLVTRAETQAESLVAALAEAGADTVELPVIAVADPADGGSALAEAASRIGSYQWVVVTSVNTVGRLFRLLRDARALGEARVAAIGPATAAALAERGVVADLVPDRYVAEALVEAFPPAPPGGGRVLLPRAAEARDVLPAGLSAKGFEVEVVEAYRVRPARPGPDALAAARRADVVTFTAPSVVRAFVDLVGTDAVPPVVACIGPVTAAEARRLGLAVAVEAPVHTTGGLVDALVRHLVRLRP
ncbi:MAG: uroporphyrinogen-III C-methyltransferase [Acidimicrobiales bacterium]|nr:uroporphyrinogen-III C-methyltransferase [Acidimicrobiales bacterium]